MNAAKIAPFLGPKATIEANVDSDSDGSDTVSLGRRLPSFHLHHGPLSTQSSFDIVGAHGQPKQTVVSS